MEHEFAKHDGGLILISMINRKKIHCEAEHYGGNAKNKTQLYWS